MKESEGNENDVQWKAYRELERSQCFCLSLQADLFDSDDDDDDEFKEGETQAMVSASQASKLLTHMRSEAEANEPGVPTML